MRWGLTDRHGLALWCAMAAALLPWPLMGQEIITETITPALVRKLAREAATQSAAGRQATLAFLGEASVRPSDPTIDPVELITAFRDAGVELAERLDEKDPAMRKLLLLTLGKMRAPAENALPHWKRAIESQDPMLMEAASEAVALYFLRIKDLRESNVAPPAARSRVLDLYAQDLMQILPLVSDMLTKQDRMVRLHACQALSNMARTIESLPQEYRFDPNHYAQFKKILPEFVLRLEDALGHCIPLLQEADMEIRLEILNTMEHIFELSVQREEMAMRNPMFSQGRLWQREFEPQGTEAAKKLIELSGRFRQVLAAQFPNASLEVRMAAMRVFENMSAADAVMIDGLILASKDPNRFIRWAAVRVLGNHKPIAYPEALQTMIRLLEDNDLGVRMAACQALGQLGKDGKPAAKAIGRCLHEGDEDVKYQAIWALNQMATEAAEALPDILKALQSPDVRLREAVPGLLVKIGQPAKAKGIPALQAALKDEEASVRFKAASALQSLLELP